MRKKSGFQDKWKKRSFIINGIAQENEVRKPLVDFLGCVRPDFFANLEKMVGSGPVVVLELEASRFYWDQKSA